MWWPFLLPPPPPPPLRFLLLVCAFHSLAQFSFSVLSWPLSLALCVGQPGRVCCSLQSSAFLLFHLYTCTTLLQHPPLSSFARSFILKNDDDDDDDDEYDCSKTLNSCVCLLASAYSSASVVLCSVKVFERVESGVECIGGAMFS